MKPTDTGEGLSIAFDAKRVFYNFTGLGNFSRTLLQHLHQYFPEANFHLFTPEAKKNARSIPFLAEPGFQIHEANFSPRSVWRSLGIGRELHKKGIPIYHGLSQELPYRYSSSSYKQIVSVHDLIFYHHPNQYKFIDRHIYRRKLQYACKVADQVIAISEATRKDLLDIYELDPKKVKVIPQTCADIFWKRKSQKKNLAILTKYKLPPDFILSVGSIIKRKNLIQVIEGMALLPDSVRPLLLVVGKGSMGDQYYRSFRERARELKMEKFIRELPEIHFEDLPALYQMARFSVYASNYEGFGLPILESIVSGTPVLTARKSSLPEVAGRAGHYLKEDHPVVMAEGLEKMLTDNSYLDELRGEGILQARKFESAKIAAQWVDLYRKTLDS
ncbi:MAG: glycosyltransferase family 4 protein [Bacteroidia bacterium]|nr:glycosyltransferase family 4 protein [Bacteroidia bacterium]